MDGGGPYRALVQALHVLVRTAGSASAAEGEAAALQCGAVLQLVLSGESHFVLQERAGEVFANGHRLRPDVMGAQALQTVLFMFQRLQLSELLFTTAAGPGQLLQFARLCQKPPQGDVAVALARLSLRGVEVGARTLSPELPQPLEPVRMPPPAAPGSSLLRSVFVQHHLIATLTAEDPVPLPAAKSVVAAVADRLLQEPQGLEPLLHLQRDRALLAHSVQVCVQSAVLARFLGCPDQLLVEIAAAGLLHGLGGPLAAAQTPTPSPKTMTADRGAATAGFVFLLGRGCSDFWLRCALVARLLPEVRGCALSEAVAETSLPAVIVRTADRFDEMRRGASVASALAALEREAEQGTLPSEGVTALHDALQACARTS